MEKTLKKNINSANQLSTINYQLSTINYQRSTILNKSANLLIVILGSTAVGKTSAAITIAKHFSTEIISADSRQFYKELTIGTAFPSSQQLSEVKHFLLGNLSIFDYYNVSRYENDVLQILNLKFKIQNLKFLLLVGGSGLYINAVCHGIDDLPDPDDNVRNMLKDTFKSKGIDALQKLLSDLDPEYYKSVDLANPNRIMRALEVCIQTGKKYSELRTQKPKLRNFKIVKIGLHKDINELYNIINSRVDIMISNGLVEEAKALYPHRNLNALNTVGYKELFSYFDGDISLEKAIEKIKTNTRHYAKRQLTWFRKDKSINWFHPEQTDKIIDFIKSQCK